MIVTTHSPLLVDLIPQMFLYVCRKRGEGTQIEPFEPLSLSLSRRPESSEALEDDGEPLSVSARFCAETWMPNVALFVEDFAHETFLKAIVQRLSEDHCVDLAFQPYSVRGWAGTVVSELRQFIRDLQVGAKCCLTG